MPPRPAPGTPRPARGPRACRHRAPRPPARGGGRPSRARPGPARGAGRRRAAWPAGWRAERRRWGARLNDRPERPIEQAMDRGLYVAASGMLAEQARQDALANDLANASTPGYKADRTTQRAFADLLLRDPATGRVVGTYA